MPIGSTRRPTHPQTRRPAPAPSSTLPPPGARVLGVDPGLASTGWAVVEERERRLVCVAAEVIVTYPAWGLPRRVGRIYTGLVLAIEQYAASHVRIEDYIAYGKDKWAAKGAEGGEEKRAKTSILLSGVGTGQAIASAVLAGLAAGATVEDPVTAWDWHRSLGIPGLSPRATSEERKALAARFIRAQVAGIPADASRHAVDAVGIAASAWLGRRAQTALELAWTRTRRKRCRSLP